MNRYHDLLGDSHLSDIKVRASNKTRTIISAYSQLLGMYGSNNCKASIEKYFQSNMTYELNNLDDMSSDVAACLGRFEHKVKVHKEHDSIFQMASYPCKLAQMLTSEAAISGETKEKYDSFDSFLLEWGPKFYPYVAPNDTKSFCNYIVAAAGNNLKFKPELFDEKHSVEAIIDI